MPRRHHRRRWDRLRRLIGRSVAWTGLWLVLAGLEGHDPLLAAVAVVAAIATATRIELDPNHQPRAGLGSRLRAIAQFVPYFLVRSWVSGVDVAARAFRPLSRGLDPALIEHHSSLPEPARVLFTGIVNLIPGTLCLTVDGRTLTLHVLDRGQDPGRQLAELEDRVAAMFGLPAAGPSAASVEAPT